MDFDKYKTRGAYHYDWYETEPWYKACVDRCVEFCKGSTLDLGCGEGLVVDLITQKGIEATGIEIEHEAVSLANPELDVRQGDVENDSFHGKWEYMVCLNVIEHLRDPGAIKRIFNRNISKAAIIITDVPQEQLSKYHVKEYSPYELKQMFHTRKVVPFKIDENFHGIEVYK